MLWVGAKGSCRTAELDGEARAGTREGHKFSNARCSAERRPGPALLVSCSASVALGSSAAEDDARASPDATRAMMTQFACAVLNIGRGGRCFFGHHGAICAPLSWKGFAGGCPCIVQIASYGCSATILEGPMKIERVFRISPALVRVILRDRPVSTNVVEGYLPRAPGKTQLVRLEAAGSHLVLQVSSDGGTVEERTKIPTAQAEALLQVSEGKIGYRRSQLRIGIEVDATLDRFEQPAGLDLVVLQFADQNEADGFSPLPWLGPEVTSEDRFSRRTLAVAGAPIEEAVEASNRSLIALVEMLEQSGGLRHLSAPALGTSLQTSVGPASETQAEEAPSRRARLPVRLPEQVRFSRANDELVANAVVDARLPAVFEAMSRELSPAPIEASPNTMAAEEPQVEIKRSGRNLKDLLRRAKSTS